jgi:hypothetical protein
MSTLTHFKLRRLNQLLAGLCATLLSTSGYADELSSKVFCQLAQDLGNGSQCIALPSDKQDSPEWQETFSNAVFSALVQATDSLAENTVTVPDENGTTTDAIAGYVGGKTKPLEPVVIPKSTESSLVIEIAGSGQGSVSTTGVICDEGKCQHLYPKGTALTLTATPQSGSTFVGWGGHSDCVDNRVTLIGSELCVAYFSVSTPFGDEAIGRIIGLSTRAVIGTRPEDNLFAGITLFNPSVFDKTISVEMWGRTLQRSNLSTDLDPSIEVLTFPDRMPISGVIDTSRTDLDVQMMTQLKTGLYTMQMSPKGSGGIGLFSVFDPDPTTEAQLEGISTRAYVGLKAENYMYAGLSVKGQVRVVIQGFGESLNSPNLATDVDAKIVVRTLPTKPGELPVLIATSNNWQENAQMAQQLRQWGKMPSAESDAALILELGEGLYTIEVSSENGHAGIAMVNVFLLK